MAFVKDTATFFQHGTAQQFEHVLSLYPQALKLKAERKTKKPEELIKLDNWYQNELPKKIKSRGKDAHLIHEELVQTMKWKQTRGKFYPQLSYLVKVNTPRAVMAETKKAFKKLPNLEQAITALSNLKGVGTTMASALLAAASPENAPFMADECLMAIPEIEGIDYTTKEYLNFVQHIQSAVARLNKNHAEHQEAEADADADVDTDTDKDTDKDTEKDTDKDKNTDADNNKLTWSPHRVELALWTHFVVAEHKPDLLSGMPTENGNSVHQNGDSLASSDESNQEPLNGKSTTIDEDTTTSFTEDSLDKPSTPIVANDETNDSIVSDSTNDSTAKRPHTDDDDSSEPTSKKSKDGEDRDEEK